MLTTKALRLMLGFVVLANTLLADAIGQSIHLPPPVIQLLPELKDTFPTLLEIRPASGESVEHILREGSKVRTYAGKLWIISTDGKVEEVEVAGRTLHDVVNTINANYKGAHAITQYPEYDGRYLDNILPRELQRNSPLRIRGGLGGPQVEATLGAVFSLSEIEQRADDNRLFSSGGVQLDLVGQKALLSDLFLRMRITFVSNDPQAINVQSGSVTGDIENASTDNIQALAMQNAQEQEPTLTTIIENAERFAIGGLLDFYVVNRLNTKVALTAEYEMAWNAFDPLQFPKVAVGNDTVSVAELYPDDRVALVRRKVNRVLPASAILLGGAVRFPAVSGLSVHALLSFGLAEQFTRKINFEAVQDPDPESLRDATESELKGVWRVGIGMTLGSALDVRADAIGPLESGDDFDPVLRLFVSKSFALKR